MRLTSGPGLALFLLSCSSSTVTPGRSASAPDAAVADTGASADTTAYCDGAVSLLDLPADPGSRGPWKVGSRAILAAGLDAEVWYPAAPGSDRGQDLYTYDLRKYLPPAQQATVTASNTILQPCNCYRDLPLDGGHGPYPVIVFLHGFSGFSGQSLEQMTHWASRGFVVVSADHPSVGLKTLLTKGIGGLDVGALGGAGCDLTAAGTQTHEAVGMLDALQSPSGDLGFLAGHIDMTRVGASGHSAGAMSIAAMSAYQGIRVVAPMAGGGVCASPGLESSLILGGQVDSIVAYTKQQSGYASTPPPKRLVGLAKAGHMAFTSFCPIGKDQGGIIAAAQNAGVVFDPAFLKLVEPLAKDGCGPTNLPPERGFEVVNFATAAAFEEKLLCLPERAAKLARLPELFPDAIGEYQEAL